MIQPVFECAVCHQFHQFYDDAQRCCKKVGEWWECEDCRERFVFYEQALKHLEGCNDE